MTTATTTEYLLTLDGIGPISLTVGDCGAGRPVLLLHGGAGPQSMAGFAGRLASATRTRVLTPTLPGFADTQRPGSLDSARKLAALCGALLDVLDLVDVTVIGNSLGGWVAAEMALLGSARIARMTLLDAVGIEVPGHRVAEVSAMTLPEILQLSFHDAAPFVPGPAALTADAGRVAGGNARALATYSGPSGTDSTLRGRLSAITMTTQVLWGASDRIADAGIGAAWAEAIPRADLRLLADTGHLPQVETPEQVITAIAGFLAASAAWEDDYTASTTAAPENVWAALRAQYTGTPVSDTGDRIVIHGPFATGTRLSVTPYGADFTVDCTITEVENGRVYGYRSNFSGLYLTSRHTLTPLPGGGTQVNHHSEIAGPAAEIAGLHIGPRITEDRAQTMRDLLASAVRRQ